MTATPTQKRAGRAEPDEIVDSSPVVPVRVPESPMPRSSAPSSATAAAATTSAANTETPSSPGMSEAASPVHAGAKRRHQESDRDFDAESQPSAVRRKPVQRTPFAQGTPPLLTGYVSQQQQPQQTGSRMTHLVDGAARQASSGASQTPSPRIGAAGPPAQRRDATLPVSSADATGQAAPVQQMHQFVQGYAYNGQVPAYALQTQPVYYGPGAGTSAGAAAAPKPQQMPIYRHAGQASGMSYQQQQHQQQQARQQKRPVQSMPRTTPSQHFLQPLPKSFSEYQPNGPVNGSMQQQQQAIQQHQQFLHEQHQRQIAFNQRQEAAARLKGFFPDVPTHIIQHALDRSRGHMEDASALLADPTFCAQAVPPPPAQSRPHPPYAFAAGAPHPFYNTAQQQQQQQTSKREIKAPTLSVREKYAIRNTQGGAGGPPPPPVGYAHGYNGPAWGTPATQYAYQQQQQQQQRTGRVLQRPPGVTPREQYQPAQYTPPQLRKRTAKAIRTIDVSDESADEDHVDVSELEEEEEEASDSDDGGEGGATESSYVPIDMDQVELEGKVLAYINRVETAKELADLGSCPAVFAAKVIEARPFETLDEVRALEAESAPTKGKRGRGQRKTAGAKMVDASVDTWEGYEAIDELVRRCVSYGTILKEAMAAWGIQVKDESAAGALEIVKMEEVKVDDAKSTDLLYLKDQPKLLPEDVRLKDYQLIGVNWLHLMYQKKLSGILADEMGLGKTCQVISFLGVLLERDIQGPHLIVVPASTLENWLRELTRFCPALKVEPYYGSQRERAEFRDAFEAKPSAYNVMVTTYQLAAGAKEDRSFLRRQKFDVCVYDEGHNLKNSASARYNYLMALPARFRLLLTGTPLQNNLKELISLLAFVLPMVFHGNLEKLDAIFKIKAFTGESKEVALLSQQRIDRAKQMMTPFVLRRYKSQVLDDMPAKHYRTDTIELNALQREIYSEMVAATRKAIEAKAIEEGKDLTELVKGKNENILMHLRKAANHPMLFRKRYDDKLLDKIAKALLKEKFFIEQGSEYNLLVEDMQVMSDFELNRLCKQYPKTQRFVLAGDPWMEACKVAHLQRLIPEMQKRGDRILLFSQFTQTLDILEDVLNTMKVSFFRLDGSTDVAKRQDMIDQFHEEEDVTVFLLSTKAGGFGINLACANVVIIYDSSYNPHDDKQAEDRAHRVGQKREVQIIRLVCKDTIEEDIQALAQTKLTLDQNVSGAGEAAGDRTAAKVAERLLSGLVKHEDASASSSEAKFDAAGEPLRVENQEEKVVALPSAAPQEHASPGENGLIKGNSTETKAGPNGEEAATSASPAVKGVGNDAENVASESSSVSGADLATRERQTNMALSKPASVKSRGSSPVSSAGSG